MMAEANNTPTTTDDSSRQFARLRLMTIGHAERIFFRMSNISESCVRQFSRCSVIVERIVAGFR